MDVQCGVVLSVVCVVGVMFLTVSWRQRVRVSCGSLPPGPPPLPLIGNALNISRRHPDLSLTQLSQVYGPVFTVWLGARPAVVLCGLEAITEALVGQSDDFCGRGTVPSVSKVTRGYGLASSNGERWRQLRKFSVRALELWGKGKSSLEASVQEEAACLVKVFGETDGKPFDPTFGLSCATANIMNAVVFGRRLSYTDPKLLTLLKMIDENMRVISSPWGQVYDMMPALMDLLPGPHNRVFRNADDIKTFLRGMILQHKDTCDWENPRDFIDNFLVKMKEEEDNPSSEFNEENLLLSTFNIFLAGTDTTSSTLRWGLLLLLKHPQVQERIQREIEEVMGSDRSPSMADRERMPYTDAVIHEIQRYANIIPLNLPHTTTRDTRFRGFIIPKGMLVIPVLASVLYDPIHWTSPHVFNPNRFLDECGRFKKNEAFIPFSTGSRMCIGEKVARTQLFVFLTALLQNFTFASQTKPEDIDISPLSSGFSTLHQPYLLYCTPRLAPQCSSVQ